MKQPSRLRIATCIILAVIIAAILTISLLISETEPETVLPISETTELIVNTEMTSVFVAADDRADMLIAKHPPRKLKIERSGNRVNITTEGRGILEVSIPSWLRIENIEINTANGDIGISKTMSDNLSLSSKSGSMLITETSASAIKAISESGNIIMTDTTAETNCIHNIAGYIRAIGILGNVESETESGGIYIVPIGNGKITAESVSGNVDVISGERAINWNTESGKVRLYGEDGTQSGGSEEAEVYIHSGSGNITISK